MTSYVQGGGHDVIFISARRSQLYNAAASAGCPLARRARVTSVHSYSLSKQYEKPLLAIQNVIYAKLLQKPNQDFVFVWLG